MDNLGDILGKRQLREPAEIKIIKDYVRDNFDCAVTVEVKPTQLLIITNSAALAGTLRLKLHELAELCQTDKRLVIRIS